MNLQRGTIENSCRLSDISAYIDGELPPATELALEAHVAICKNCLEELNLQKQMLSVLDFSLDEKTEIELPENFAKVVAVRAESRVCGLRSKEERFWAMFLSALMFLIVLLGLGAETGSVLTTLKRIFEQTITIAGFIGHLIYNLAVGVIIILRSLSGQFVFNSVFSLIALAGLSAVSAVLISRVVFRYKRS
jgi:anti-sigma factor RsiW